MSETKTLQAALQGASCDMVARDGSSVVGPRASVFDDASIAYLQDSLVHLDCRRSGVDTALVHAAPAHAKYAAEGAAGHG